MYIMTVDVSVYELAKRAENFRWNTKNLKYILEEMRNYFFDCTEFDKTILEFCEISCTSSSMRVKQIEGIFKEICCAITKTPREQELLSYITADIVEICTFMTLCAFFHTSKRIRGKSLRDFVLQNSPFGFSDPNSPNYRAVSFLDTESERLRKGRIRLLSQRKVYVKNSQWHAITKDSEYEWKFYYDLQNESKDVQEAFRRQRNLYSGIREVVQSENIDDFKSEMARAYQKFLSKLGKLKYANYIELQKVIMSRISCNLEYYGINLYRLETSLHPYIITNEVKKLEESNSDAEEAEILLKTVWLDDICFPNIYEKLFALPLQETKLYAEVFLQYLKRVTMLSCLILDVLVENNFFGDTWEAYFIDISNQMAEKVLYDPSTIDYSVTEKSQQKFLRLLHAGVLVEVCTACHSQFRMADLLI